MPTSPSAAAMLNGREYSRILGATHDNDSMTILVPEGEFLFHHRQDCCESVRIVAISGDIPETGHIISCVESDQKPEWCEKAPLDFGSHTWTVFTFQVLSDGKNSTFTIVWLGESNGYYTENVSLDFSSRP